MQKHEEFSNRWGIILASLGMAIGAGNLWRFPRLAGQYGGSFIILWILFLFIWSIPLLLAEFSIGKKFKSGVIGSFGKLVGSKLTWMGFFITVCTLGIAFYYSVVTAWSLEYLGISIGNLINGLSGGVSLGERLSNNPEYLQEQWALLSNQNLLTIALYALVVGLGVFVVSRGVKGGLEKANKVLIPSLFVLLLIVAVAALLMPDGVKGLEYMFTIDPKNLSNPTIWIEALSQSAWSTGAGWGLMITISSYSRSKEDITLNTFIGAFGNNTASILAGMAILPAVFALASSEQAAIASLQSGSQALTFTIIPELFATLPGGGFLAVVFFLALTLAAFSSFLPMLELLKTNLVRTNLTQRGIIVVMVLVFILFGFPSAYSLDYFSNQDWVWGLGLIVSGVFIAIATAVYGPNRFKTELMDIDSDFKVSGWYFSAAIYLNIVMGVGIIYWWMSQGYSQNPWFDENGAWNWWDVYSNATITTQWGTVLLLGILLNSLLYRQFVQKEKR
ncbi:sodium-dependent transporter [Marinoscillum furvescens]|uniref:NSS family neurotransmitter:Na+ symporter n=1 Tax=Marinoscillum furvescens DSM 4134 TaxID=1122208 RepID=A0A3D9L1P0_MARFU|nr:sodium-dependent transporter [Marinoscillum furvescens]RED97955.1 NSS family neurotransmitter:Na+ symporter [Marinoscillum furvescens DSM 4134]